MLLGAKSAEAEMAAGAAQTTAASARSKAVKEKLKVTLHEKPPGKPAKTRSKVKKEEQSQPSGKKVKLEGGVKCLGA
jgi:hypothetical protein